MMRHLILKTWRDHGRSFMGWLTGLVAIMSVQLAVYPTIKKSAKDLTNYVNSFPPALQEIFRMRDYTSGPGYISTELLSFMVPFIFIAVGASWGANATALEEERGTADFLLALPVSRSKIIGAKLIAGLTAQILMGGFGVVTIIVGRRFVELEVIDTNVVAAILVCVLLGFLAMGISLLIGATAGRRAFALGVTITVALASFLFYSLAPLVDTFDRILPLNPFEWTLGSDPIRQGFDWWHLTLTLFVAAMCYLGAALSFRRRDVAA